MRVLHGLLSDLFFFGWVLLSLLAELEKRYDGFFLGQRIVVVNLPYYRTFFQSRTQQILSFGLGTNETNDRKAVVNHCLFKNQTWELKLTWKFAFLNNFQRGRVLTIFDEQLIKRQIQIKENVSYVLGHAPKVMVNESKTVFLIFILHSVVE